MYTKTDRLRKTAGDLEFPNEGMGGVRRGKKVNTETVAGVRNARRATKKREKKSPRGFYVDPFHIAL